MSDTTKRNRDRQLVRESLDSVLEAIADTGIAANDVIAVMAGKVAALATLTLPVADSRVEHWADQMATAIGKAIERVSEAARIEHERRN